MSGGSYNYLFVATDLDWLVERRHHLRNMADRLARLGYARDAAIETQALVAELDAIDVRIAVASERLGGVWKAIEWWEDCDWGEDSVHKALAEYRGGQE